MGNKFEYSFEDLSRQDIESFEKRNNIKLPIDYKEFLLKHNGGKPSVRRFVTQDGKITSSIMMFFPLTKQVEMNLEDKYKMYNISRIVPSNFLPIGIDPADSLICLSVNGNDVGKVYFCDMDYFEEDKELKEEFIVVIAENFTDFTSKLFVSDNN
ncbi:SMI1/KNR4 family protein [Brevibacillus antibioticus]|uniref:SMI1/KNR4 family protein n=1 Tax=Brevibacillus antibioticus TaxID=2570228 RepID=A0A4U2Y194_9BACL|nr:SMI1/KNR4 family protein [Brevibacillus antibioticus]TKI54126.1 SMI1/KNR4 family protein [Brevibacillus antibioticus]